MSRLFCHIRVDQVALQVCGVVSEALFYSVSATEMKEGLSFYVAFNSLDHILTR